MRDTERGRDIGRGRGRFSGGSLMPDLVPGPQGSQPEPKADAQLLNHPGVPGRVLLKGHNGHI